MPGVVARGRGRRSISEINMVPFIDVTLVLLIIFMVSAPLITTGVVDLPSMGKAKQRPPSVIEVIVGTDERIKIRIDKAVRYESIVKVMDTLQRAGVQRVGLAVKQVG